MEPERERILDLIVRWEEARAQGQDPEPEELCRECPGLLSGFRRQVERLGQVEWLNGPIEADTTTPGSISAMTPDADLPRMIGDRYRLDALIGQGGFGRVYRGFDAWLERVVAVKVPRVDRPVTAGEVDQCRIEARKVAKLRHPNIVPVHDVGRDGTTCFIVGEWIEGTNLAERIREDRPDRREAARARLRTRPEEAGRPPTGRYSPTLDCIAVAPISGRSGRVPIPTGSSHWT